MNFILNKKIMDSIQLDRVKAALNAKHYTVNDSWLRDGIEFYVSENGQTSMDALLSFMISQWLLCDLREINNSKGCLPSNLTQQKCVKLPGRYILQMDYLYDISVSKYKQLEKIRNVSNENVEATESENATQMNTQGPQSNNFSWEPKSKRMMQLKLTDGKQDILAIEHKTIHFFDDTSKLLPGFKVMIQGPVTCRRGIILLEENNILPMGGEVESFLIPFAVENVFARALKLEENPNPYVESADSQSDFFRSDTTTHSSTNGTVDCHDNRSNNQSNKNSDNRRQPTSTTNTNIVDNMDDFFEDEFNEIDFNELDRHVESVSQEQAPHTSNNFAHQLKVKVTNPANIRNPQPPQGVERRNENVNLDDHFGDDFEIEEIERASTSWNRPSTSRANVPNRSPNRSNIVQPANAPLENDANFEMDLTEDDWGSFKAPTKPVPNMSSQNANKKQSEPAVSSLNPKRSIDKVTPPKETNPTKLRRNSEVMTNVRKITDFVQQKPNKSSLGIEFICDILREPATTTPKRKKIRGKVIDVSRLNVNSQSLWSLTATLTDDTSNIDVDFSSQALDRLFGFTVEDFKKKKQMKKHNPEIMISLRQDIQIAEQKIIKMDAMVELEFVKDKKPLVTNISELSAEQKRQINEAVAKLKKVNSNLMSKQRIGD